MKTDDLHRSYSLWKENKWVLWTTYVFELVNGDEMDKVPKRNLSNLTQGKKKSEWDLIY